MSQDLLDYDDALAIVLQHAQPRSPHRLPLLEALGRTIVEPILSLCDLPAFDNSAVDGYAVRIQDLDHTSFIVGRELRAGQPMAGSWLPGVALRVFTGAALPPETGAVVMQEDVSVVEGRAQLSEPAALGANIRRRGEELRCGTEVAPAGVRLSPALAAAAAASGNAEVAVGGPLQLGIVVTGSELVAPGSFLPPGRIYESNGTGLAAAAGAMGLGEALVRCVPEDLEATAEAIRAMAERCDLVIATGGVSVGDHDHTHGAFEAAGFERVFWGVRMKPGKPVAFYRRGDRVAFGLPGNPLSTMVGWCVLVRPFVRKALGLPEDEWFEATAQEAIRHRPDRLEFVPVAWDGVGVRSFAARGSHMLGGLVGANALARIEAERGDVAAGQVVRIARLEWFDG